MILKFIEVGKMNANRITYPKKTIETAIENVKDTIKQKRLVVFDKVDTESFVQKIENICGIVENIYLEGNEGFIDLKLLDLPKCGDIQILLEANKLFAVSRGIGEIDDYGVVRNYTLHAIDLTSKPSWKEN